MCVPEHNVKRWLAMTLEAGFRFFGILRLYMIVIVERDRKCRETELKNDMQQRSDQPRIKLGTGSSGHSQHVVYI